MKQIAAVQRSRGSAAASISAQQAAGRVGSRLDDLYYVVTGGADDTAVVHG